MLDRLKDIIARHQRKRIADPSVEQRIQESRVVIEQTVARQQTAVREAQRDWRDTQLANLYDFETAWNARHRERGR